MRSIDEILEQAKRLSPQERAELVERLEELTDDESAERAASAEGPYARTLAASGTVRSDFTDISSDKYKHLAVAYADGNDG